MTDWKKSITSAKAHYERKYPYCEFILNENDGLVSVMIDDFAFGVFSIKCEVNPNELFIANYNTFKELEPKMIEKGYQNYIATLNSDGSVFFSNSEGQALEAKKDNNVYVKLVGEKKKKNKHF